MDETEIRVTRAAGGAHVVSVCGDVDSATCPDLRAALLGARGVTGCQIIIDLERVEFMDVAGLTVLEEVAGRISSSGGTLTLRRPGPAVRYLLDFRRRFTTTEPWTIES